jgi:hypothetical protein
MTRSRFGRAMVVLAALLPGASTPLMAAPGKADASEKARTDAAAKAEAEKARSEVAAKLEAEKRRAEAADKAEQARKHSKSESDRKADAERHRDDKKTKRDDSKRDKPDRAKSDDKKAERDREGREADKRRYERNKAAEVQKAEAAPKPEAAEAVPAPAPAPVAASVPVPMPRQWAITNATMPKSISAIGQAGAPDAGPPPGQSLLVSFDTPNAAGVTEFSSGSVITAAGSIGGVRAAPAGNGSVYRSLGGGGQSTFDFSGWTKGAPLASLSFEWGSIDSYNFVDFLNQRGETVWTMAGSDFPQYNGDQAAAITNQRVLISFQREADIAAVRMRSKGAAFEFDRLAGAVPTGTVPEPASWLMMIIGFGFVGFGLRRKRMRAVSA